MFHLKKAFPTQRHLLVQIFLLAMILTGTASKFQLTAAEVPEKEATSFSAFPIAMYNSDIGFGVGGKGVLKNLLYKDESFDVILFASSKGEQWYVLTFSIPDREIRQGAIYHHALDAKIEYDKLSKSNFFGIGNGSPDNEHLFPKEIVRLEVSDSRAFSHNLIGELGVRLASYSIYDWDPHWQTITYSTPGIGWSQVLALSSAVRWDDRDSQVNPHSGKRLELRLDCSPEQLNDLVRQGNGTSTGQAAPHWSFTKLRVELSDLVDLKRGFVSAWRLWLQQVDGPAPFNELSFLGGGITLRGYKYERLLDEASALASAELRLPLGRLAIPQASSHSLLGVLQEKLGGVVFVDAGRVSPRMEKMSLNNWYWDMGIGLRYCMRDFVVRGDIGKSSEGMRLFLNFGQVF
jgi:outer membrane protein assembly factor BamA